MRLSFSPWKCIKRFIHRLGIDCADTIPVNYQRSDVVVPKSKNRFVSPSLNEAKRRRVVGKGTKKMGALMEARLNRKWRREKEGGRARYYATLCSPDTSARLRVMSLHARNRATRARPLIWEQFIGKWSRRAVYTPPSYYTGGCD